jgi:hypothetical protein
MTFPSVRVEGAILSGELLGKLDAGEFPGQRPADFGLDSSSRLKVEIARAWTHAHNAWRMHADRLNAPRASKSGITETRNFIEGVLGLLGYAELEFQPQAELVGDKPFRISHRLRSHDGFAINIVGARESLDRKPEAGAGPRVSPHAHVQEYLNLTEHVFAIVTNARILVYQRDCLVRRHIDNGIKPFSATAGSSTVSYGHTDPAYAKGVFSQVLNCQVACYGTLWRFWLRGTSADEHRECDEGLDGTFHLCHIFLREAPAPAML